MIELGRIYNEDCLETMKRMEDESVDAFVLDPPFSFAGGLSNGRTSIADDQFFSHWWRDVAQNLVRVTKPNGEGFIWCDWKTVGIIASGFERSAHGYDPTWRVQQVLHHYREMPGMGKPFRNSVDMIAYCRGSKNDKTRIPNTEHNWISKYWYYGKHEYHPAEKDVEIASQLIKWCSDLGDVVYDPFMGSGTTAVACEKLGRRWVGSEINPEYVKIAEKRIEAVRAQGNLFNNTEPK